MPSDPPTSLQDGLAAFSRKEYDVAIASLNDAIVEASAIADREQRRAALATIFEKRSESYLRTRQFEQAAGDGVQLCALRPTEPVGYIRVAEALRGAKRFHEARAYIDRAIEVVGST